MGLVMKRLWFENADGEERVINKHADTWAEVNETIDEFIKQCNIKKSNTRKLIYGDSYDPAKDNPFIRYYTRVWQQKDGRTRIDVGSHTEFFIWEGKYPVGE